MATSLELLVIPKGTARAIGQDVFKGCRIASTDTPWEIAEWEPGLPLSLDEILDLMTRVVDSPDALAFAAMVEDGDYAVLSWTSFGTTTDGVVLNKELAKNYDLGVAALRRWPKDFGVAASVSRWSSAMPRTVSAERVASILSFDYTDMVDVITDLLREFGIRSEWPPSQFVEAVEIDMSSDSHGKRYVSGYGNDFAGVWDRTRVGPAFERFPRTEDGRAVARRLAAKMNKGLDRRGFLRFLRR